MGNITIQGDLTGGVPGGEVGGGNNLTTVGAIPYVSAPGVLNQDATKLFWDATNGRLGVGTASPTNLLEVVSGIHRYAFQPVASNGFVVNNNGFTFSMASSSTLASLTTNVTAIAFLPAGTERARFAVTTGNLLIGTTTDDTTNKLQVAGGVNFGGTSGLTWDNVNARLGIGTNSPTLPLDIVGSAPKLQLNRTSVSARLILENSGSAWYINSADNNALAFQTSNIERARFHSSTGNFLVSTSTDSGFKLDVASSGSSGTLRVYDQTATTGTTKAVVRAGAGQSGNLQEWQNSAGSAFAYVTSSGQVAGSDFYNINGLYFQTSNVIDVAQNFQIRFSSTSSYGGSKDLGLSRNAAGVLEVNNGTAGTLRDLKLRNITVMDTTAVTGSTLAVIQAGAGQSGNLLSVRNNAGTELAGIDGTGKYRSDWHTDLADTSMALRASALQLNSTYVFQWSSGGSYGNAKDIGLARAAAGYLKVTDGSTGLGKIVVSQSTPSASTDAGTAGAIWADATYIYVQTAAGTIKRVALTTF